MNISKAVKFTLLTLSASILASCQSAQSIPQDQLKNYAVVETGTNEYGADLDTSTDKFPALVSYINGTARWVSSRTMDLLPGEYQIQLGMACGNTATCHPGRKYDLNVEAGKRYVLKPYAVLVSDRDASRSGEIPYKNRY
ncbi:hypothetical protein [Sulfuriferula nivalis]|uniref:Lipoprotein n=1 Tax=Sulfuriferula nivalis TaxID=2675298 RepID=A0A809RD77_9PROT|nr:hypothetical protein [Sulfuriferula nivalis]BBO99605.1 hypothetical protein SFSGTM_03140 [Sulfuriferula nivalis]